MSGSVVDEEIVDDGRLTRARSSRIPYVFRTLDEGEERRLRAERRARAFAASREAANLAATEQAAAAARAAAMTSSAASSAATSVAFSSGPQFGMPTRSTGTSSLSGSRQSTSQMEGSQYSPLTPREREMRELQQVKRIRAQLEKDLKEATDREKEIKNRTARLETLETNKAKFEGLDDSGMNEPMKVLRDNMLSLHARLDSRMDFMQNTLDQILDILSKLGFRPPAQSPLPLTAMSGPFPVQAGSQPSGRGNLFPGFKLGKHVRPVEVLAASTQDEVGMIPSLLHDKAQANDPLVAPQTQLDQTMLCTLDVSEALEDLESEWSNKDPRESWVALRKGPRGEHFVVEVDVEGRKWGAFIDIGSTRNYISRDCLERLHLKDRVRHLSRPVASTLANKERMIVTDYIKDVVCTFSYGGGVLNHKISFLVSDDLPFDMLLGMYNLEVAKPQFDWDKKVLKHKLPEGRTVTLTKFKASSIIDTYGCLCASAFYNYYKQNEEEGMYLVYVSEKGEVVKTPPEIERVVAKFPDLFEEPTGVVEREVVHAIEIIPGSKTPKGRIYRMAPVELDELRRQLKELTEKGWIRPSASPYGSPVLFVPKKGGTLRMRIDYRGLNAITVKNAEPLPRIDDLLDRVQGCKYYTKIDLKYEYHQIAIRPEDQHKTTFQTRYGLYEFVVMPFGLCNAPGTFQHAMNPIFHDHLDTFVVVNLDDILIFSKSAEEHAQHVETVLQLLRQHKYKVNLEKCAFGRTTILYLGHVVSEEGIRPEDAKWLVFETGHNLRQSLSSTDVSPNQLHFGWKPRSALDFLLPENRPAATLGTLEYGVQYEKLLQEAVEHMKKAQHTMIASENQHRRQSTFQVGERVWVKVSELGQEFGISRKLMPQYFGPWEVLDVVGDELDGPTYVIRVPGHLRTHPVFHASKLAPSAETDQFPSKRSMLPPTMDGQVDIDDIVDHRDMPVPKPLGRGRPPKPKREYRIRFRHHTDPKEDRWFTREELMEIAPQVVVDYERKLKGKAPAK
ncbi:hypothetical protein CBR_g30440 [Chara braunii]|uniref:Reverse transcriptase domain-containing protein n=1 Tax=Chara braunii TaxID=69332 RepID=A0A388LCZ4_CHABU|nr:hypothetical protein CBR_g30440 [Chara braunii]|eukprot:GBG80073.1 hypothetical protein CBR_g30440 [Chara braunii]